MLEENISHSFNLNKKLLHETLGPACNLKTQGSGPKFLKQIKILHMHWLTYTKVVPLNFVWSCFFHLSNIKSRGDIQRAEQNSKSKTIHRNFSSYVPLF